MKNLILVAILIASKSVFAQDISLNSGSALVGNGGSTSTQLLYWNGTDAYYGRKLTGMIGVNSHNFRIDGNTKLIINSLGYVGIGTDIPVSSLDVNGEIAIKYGSAFRVNVPDGNSGNWTAASNRIIFKTNWSQTLGDYVDFKVPGAVSNSALLRFTKSGRIGIGVENPSQALDVSGSINASASIYSNGDLYFKRDSEVKIKSFTGGGNTPSQTHTIIKNGWRHNQDYTSIHAAGITGNTDASIVIKGDGNVGIGTTNPDSKLSVNGTIHTKEVKVDLNGWSDFVFEKDYELRTLEEVEQHINENGHLPEIPSEAEVTENGINLGEMDAKLLMKIEELTLYMIDMNKQVQQLKTDNKKLKEKVQSLENE